MFSDGDSNVRKFNTINRRVFILSIAKGVIFTGILARLFTLQISDSKKYLTLEVVLKRKITVLNTLIICACVILTTQTTTVRHNRQFMKMLHWNSRPNAPSH